VNVLAPQLEVVGEQHSAPMAPEDAQSMVAMKRMGANFKEFNSNSTIMIVVEGQKPLGPDALTVDVHAIGRGTTLAFKRPKAFDGVTSRASR
jgi:uncharacterized membrane protein YdfJ with MMPL/SSD domain